MTIEDTEEMTQWLAYCRARLSEIDYRRGAYDEAEGKLLFPDPDPEQLRAEFDAWFVPRETMLRQRALAHEIQRQLDETRAAKRKAADRRYAERMAAYRKDAERLERLRADFDLKRAHEWEAKSEAEKERLRELVRTRARTARLEAEFEARRAKAEAPYRPSREGNLGEVRGQVPEISLYLDDEPPADCQTLTTEEASTFLIDTEHVDVFCVVCDVACGQSDPIPISPHGWILPSALAYESKSSYACRECSEVQSAIGVPYLATDIVLRVWDGIQKRLRRKERASRRVARWDRIQELFAEGQSGPIIARNVELSTSQLYRVRRSPRPKARPPPDASAP